MKYLILALLVATATAYAIDQENSQEISIEDAAFPIMNLMNMQRVGYSIMGNPTMMMNPMMIPKPPQKAVDHYNSLNDDDFPVDYSMSCSNTCGCRQTCMMMWWVPCSCMCPPPCPTTTTEAPVRFPPRQPRPEPIPPANPQFPSFPNINIPRLTTEAPSQQPQFPWQQPPPPPPNPQFPNINLPRQTTQSPVLTFPPQPPYNPPPCDSPSWNNNWNNNNNNEILIHPPAWNPQPIWPQPEPEPQWPWINQPQVPLPLPEPLPPNNNNWNNNWNNNNNQFPPNWPQPRPEPIPPPRDECNSCNNQCTCTPCSVIWVCPPPCPTNCCNGNCARHFGDIENGLNYHHEQEETVDEINSNKIAFQHIPEYLQDIFIPGMI